jgi:hypothetical protein
MLPLGLPVPFMSAMIRQAGDSGTSEAWIACSAFSQCAGDSSLNPGFAEIPRVILRVQQGSMALACYEVTCITKDCFSIPVTTQPFQSQHNQNVKLRSLTRYQQSFVTCIG